MTFLYLASRQVILPAGLITANAIRQILIAAKFPVVFPGIRASRGMDRPGQ